MVVKNELHDELIVKLNKDCFIILDRLINAMGKETLSDGPKLENESLSKELIGEVVNGINTTYRQWLEEVPATKFSFIELKELYKKSDELVGVINTYVSGASATIRECEFIIFRSELYTRMNEVM